MMPARLARAAAIAIAIAAAFDPAFTRDRAVPVTLALVHQPADVAFVADIRRALSPGFSIVDGPSVDAQAVLVIARDGAPLPRVDDTTRVFAIEPPRERREIRVRAFDVPPTIATGRTAAAHINVDATGLRGQTLTLSLYAGERLTARETRAIDRDDHQVSAALSFLAAANGLTPLRIEASAGGFTAVAGAATTTATRPLRVLFIGARPAWSATFIRRALEQDPAFEVSSMVATSRGVASITDDAPGLNTPAGRERFDVVVAGAPSTLTESSMRELETFARERGGSIVLLADAESSRALARLTSAGSWSRRAHDAPVMAIGRHGALRLSESLTTSASAISPEVLAAASGALPVVTQFPSGEGHVIVSGALDDWRYRIDKQASYGRFWKGAIADAALASKPPMSLRVTPLSARPGDEVTIEASVRGTRPGETVSIEASMSRAGEAARTIRLWPSATPGFFTGRAIAPATDGISKVTASARAGSGALRAETAFVVSSAAIPVDDGAPGTAAMLASTHRGAYIEDGGIDALQAALAQAFPAHTAPATIHPMRYAWWLLPFTALLGYEWRWRRRHGLK